jgi:hypothetical protein
LFPKTPLAELQFQRFCSISFVSTSDGWLRLYRGYPAVTPATRATISSAAAAGVKWISDNREADGRFVYYYDAATDSHRDHEHPKRDPQKDPYYNLLRHCGGVVTMLLASSDGGILPRDGGRMPPPREAIEAGIDFFVRQLVPYSAENGRPAAYAYYNRKAKLGGSGIGLYMLSLYQRVFASDRYAEHARLLANHLVNEISKSGEFRYYHVYLDRPVAQLADCPSPAATTPDPPTSGAVTGCSSSLTSFSCSVWERTAPRPVSGETERPARVPAQSEGTRVGTGEHLPAQEDETDEQAVDNRNLFSFYYPGEAVIGLANYCLHVCKSHDERDDIYARLHHALRFLFIDRPRMYRHHYTPLPADSWLMMAVNDLWNVPEFRQPGYSEPVFKDADQMVAHMYTPQRSPFPDYAGSFFYQYGDHPYPDGARAEGLLAAYLLARKMGERARVNRYQEALQLLAWATLRLCNTRESVYSVPNPDRTIGGIRFKLTRQWFRVDTIQHVASFYLKFLPYFENA